MSMLMQYFVCSKETIREWARSLSAHDIAAMNRAESRMEHSITLKNLSGTDVRLLACCAPGFEDAHACSANLVTALNEIEGPYVMVFDRAIIQTIANIQLSEQVIDEWVQRATIMMGDREHRARYLTSEPAESLQKMCQTALQKELEFYCCYFG